jgi:hypothetical protein
LLQIHAPAHDAQLLLHAHHNHYHTQYIAPHALSYS